MWTPSKVPESSGIQSLKDLLLLEVISLNTICMLIYFHNLLTTISPPEGQSVGNNLKMFFVVFCPVISDFRNEYFGSFPCARPRGAETVVFAQEIRYEFG